MPPLRTGDAADMFVVDYAGQSPDASLGNGKRLATLADDDLPPPLVDPPPLQTQFSVASPDSPYELNAEKNGDEDHIPRPPNAFILFRSTFIKEKRVSTEVETNHSTLSKIIGMHWKKLPENERQVWKAKAREALKQHKKMFPNYTFRPTVATTTKDSDAVSLSSAPTQRKKRPQKKRKVVQKDETRCEKIAELLSQGMTGEELDLAIQDFDRTHVPQLVMQFEEPLTAKWYSGSRRRSSSVPPITLSPVHTSFPASRADDQPSLSSSSSKRRSSSLQPSLFPHVRPAESSAPAERKQSLRPDRSFTSILPPLSMPVKPQMKTEFNSFSFENYSAPADEPVFDPLTSPVLSSSTHSSVFSLNSPDGAPLPPDTPTPSDASTFSWDTFSPTTPTTPAGFFDEFPSNDPLSGMEGSFDFPIPSSSETMPFDFASMDSNAGQHALNDRQLDELFGTSPQDYISPITQSHASGISPPPPSFEPYSPIFEKQSPSGYGQSQPSFAEYDVSGISPSSPLDPMASFPSSNKPLDVHHAGYYYPPTLPSPSFYPSDANTCKSAHHQEMQQYSQIDPALFGFVSQNYPHLMSQQ